MQPVLPFRPKPDVMNKIAKPFQSARIDAAVSSSRRFAASAGWAGATPCFGAPVRPNRLGSASGRSRPPCARTILAVDVGADIADDADIDGGVITERNSRLDHDGFNRVDNSRITRESPRSSRAIEEYSSCR